MDLQLDHVVPRSKGGPDDEGNLITACSDCNAGKTDRCLPGIERDAAQALEILTERLWILERLSTEVLGEAFSEEEAANEPPLIREWVNAMVAATFAIRDHGYLSTSHQFHRELVDWRRRVAANRARARRRTP